MKELSDTVAYCGLICGICYGLGPENCDCRTNPKPQADDCYQRNCCIGKGIEGCWECEEFPCENGCFGEYHLGWRGLCVASVQYAREHGVRALVELFVLKEGMRINHSPYLNRTPEEVLKMLKDKDPLPQTEAE